MSMIYASSTKQSARAQLPKKHQDPTFWSQGVWCELTVSTPGSGPPIYEGVGGLNTRTLKCSHRCTADAATEVAIL